MCLPDSLPLFITLFSRICNKTRLVEITITSQTRWSVFVSNFSKRLLQDPWQDSGNGGTNNILSVLSNDTQTHF